MNSIPEDSISMLQEILASSFDGILVTDGNGKILMMNHAYVRNTGLTQEELLGRNLHELLNPVWMKESVALLAIEQRSPVTIRQLTRNGKDIIVTGTPVFDQDGGVKMVVVNTRDMSEISMLQKKLEEMKRMEELYQQQLNGNVRVEDKELSADEVIVGNSKLQKIYQLAGKVAPFDVTVLITGESGVGKELVASYIHRKNPMRKDKPFVTVNCAAIPNELLESELFGYQDGAFTGAARGGKIGLFEAANGGTLFLDEVGEIQPSLQAKVLRALESRSITRVGSTKQIPLDIRIISATNRDLAKEVAQDNFREDLYYRLNVVDIHIPPLRERRDEIAALALNYVAQFNAKYHQNKRLTYEAIQEFEQYEWKGNIRQLRNVVESMVVISPHDYLQLSDIPWRKKEPAANAIKEESLPESLSLAELMCGYEKKILVEAKQKYGSTRKIAAALCSEQSTIVRKMKKYGISGKE